MFQWSITRPGSRNEPGFSQLCKNRLEIWENQKVRRFYKSRVKSEKKHDRLTRERAEFNLLVRRPWPGFSRCTSWRLFRSISVDGRSLNVHESGYHLSHQPGSATYRKRPVKAWQNLIHHLKPRLADGDLLECIKIHRNTGVRTYASGKSLPRVCNVNSPKRG